MKILVGDFETTVYENQEYTEVWASALVEMGTEDVMIFHSIDETYDYLLSLKENVLVYYHNLKFDGSFWLYYLIQKLGYKQDYFKNEEGDYQFNEGKLTNKTVRYAISDLGQWYNIQFKYDTYTIELRDSLKLLPFSVKRIGESFKTKHKKLDMEYKGYRYAGCEITDEEKQYIANDVLVVKEALEFMYEQGHKRLTIGSCCLDEFKKTVNNFDYDAWFPNVYDIPLDPQVYGSKTAGDYIRKSYKGGWCYLVKGKENKIKHNGTTADVNSLYPSMMLSESGNVYPVGVPFFFQNEIPDFCFNDEYYFFVRIKTRFYIKKDKLPTIQIKGNVFYKGTEWLTTSDIWNPRTQTYCQEYVTLDGEILPAVVELTLTKTDYILFCEHYAVKDFQVLDGCYFHTVKGVFDEYLTHYREIKQNSKGAMRELAKLFSNNLYGKLAASMESSFKYIVPDEEGILHYYVQEQFNKTPGYIPIGSAITSYARNFTIRAAQANYYGPDNRGFIYADTDSIHCDLQPHEIKGIKVDDKLYNHWKLEANWDYAIFVRQKTYIEHVIAENLEPIEEPYLSIKCAGMPDRCKNLLKISIDGRNATELTEKELDYFGELTPEEEKFLETPRTIENFKKGLLVPGKLLPRQIKGGIVLVDTTYEMRY